MYNYVCAVDVYKRDTSIPFAIKVGVSTDYMNRFVQICKEVQAEERTIDYASVSPLFIIEGNYDKYVGERIEDVLRLYYLKKLGYKRGYKQDWINSTGLPLRYDVEQEIEDIERLLAEWFPDYDLKIIFKSTDLTLPRAWQVFSCWEYEMKHLV